MANTEIRIESNGKVHRASTLGRPWKPICDVMSPRSYFVTEKATTCRKCLAHEARKARMFAEAGRAAR